MTERHELRWGGFAGIAFVVLAVCAALFLAGVVMAIMANGSVTRSDELTVTLFQASMVLNAMIGLAAAVPLTAAGIGVLRTRMMPDWLGYVLTAGGIFVLCASGFMVREHLPEITPATATQLE